MSDQDKMISRSDAKMSELASEQTRLKKAQQSLMVCVVGVSTCSICSGRAYVQYM